MPDDEEVTYIAALTQKELDAMGCGKPGCTHDHSIIHLHAQCHRRTGLKVCYDKLSGALLVTCAICKEPVAAILVAGDHDAVRSLDS